MGRGSGQSKPSLSPNLHGANPSPNSNLTLNHKLPELGLKSETARARIITLALTLTLSSSLESIIESDLLPALHHAHAQHGVRRLASNAVHLGLVRW